jgi:mono/diheme cytochrome c family protein
MKNVSKWVGVVAVLALSACEEKKAAPPPPPPSAKTEPVAAAPAAAAAPDAEKEAGDLFSMRCASCHGTAGKGDGPAAAALKPPPRDYTDAKWQAETTDEQIEKAIVGGGPAVGKSPMMPPNPDLSGKPEVVAALRKRIRAFGGK